MSTITDVLNSNVFAVRELTEALQKMPYVPSQLQKSGLFVNRSVSKSNITIEFANNQFSVLTSTKRGSPAQVNTGGKRTSVDVSIPRFALDDLVLADEIVNVRAFGSTEAASGYAEVVNNKLEVLKLSHAATLEYLQAKALVGTIVDGAGNTIYNLNTVFGTSQSTAFFAITAGTEVNLLSKVVAAKRIVQAGLGNAPYTGMACACSAEFMDDFINQLSFDGNRPVLSGINPATQDLRDGFVFGGVNFYEYRGFANDGTTQSIAAEYAYMYPTGCPGMFINYYGPGDEMEFLGIGQPLYAKAVEDVNGKGILIKTQMNVLPVVTRPNAVCQCRTAAS